MRGRVIPHLLRHLRTIAVIWICRGDFDGVNHPKTAEDYFITYSGMGMCGSAPLQNPGKYKGKRTRLKAIFRAGNSALRQTILL